MKTLLQLKQRTLSVVEGRGTGWGTGNSSGDEQCVQVVAMWGVRARDCIVGYVLLILLSLRWVAGLSYVCVRRICTGTAFGVYWVECGQWAQACELMGMTH